MFESRPKSLMDLHCWRTLVFWLHWLFLKVRQVLREQGLQGKKQKHLYTVFLNKEPVLLYSWMVTLIECVFPSVYGLSATFNSIYDNFQNDYRQKWK